MPQSSTQRLAELIRRKRECLAQLLQLGQRQRALIEAEQLTQLLDLLAVKQRVLGQLQPIERELDPFRSQRPEDRRWAAPADRQRCLDDLEACQQLLEQIVALEKQSEAELIQRRDAAGEQLHGAHRAREARNAYVAPSPREFSQFDSSSNP